MIWDVELCVWDGRRRVRRGGGGGGGLCSLLTLGLLETEEVDGVGGRGEGEDAGQGVEGEGVDELRGRAAAELPSSLGGSGAPDADDGALEGGRGDQARVGAEGEDGDICPMGTLNGIADPERGRVEEDDVPPRPDLGRVCVERVVFHACGCRGGGGGGGGGGIS